MAKILKVKIKRDETAGKVSYTYPKEYNKDRIKVLCYEHANALQDIISRGNVDEYCIGVVSSVDAPAFLASPDIVELAKADAEIQGNLWRPQTDIIFDATKVINVLAKAARNEALTQKEKDAINPDNAERGINKSQSFKTLLSQTILEVK